MSINTVAVPVVVPEFIVIPVVTLILLPEITPNVFVKLIVTFSFTGADNDNE